MSGLSVAELDALIAEATVDCYDEDEQVLGLYSVMADELACLSRRSSSESRSPSRTSI
jgi:hypothetical protein